MSLRAQSGANGVTFDSINFSSGGGTISNSATKNMTIKNSAFGTAQLLILTTNFNNNNILIGMGYLLGQSSIGKNAGTDGKDMGINSFGSVVNPTAPQAPTNLKVF